MPNAGIGNNLRRQVLPVWFHLSTTPTAAVVTVYKWDFSALTPAIVAVDLSLLSGQGLAITSMTAVLTTAANLTVFHDTDGVTTRVFNGPLLASSPVNVLSELCPRYLPPQAVLKATSTSVTNIMGCGFIYAGGD